MTETLTMKKCRKRLHRKGFDGVERANVDTKTDNIAEKGCEVIKMKGSIAESFKNRHKQKKSQSFLTGLVELMTGFEAVSIMLLCARCLQNTARLRYFL